MDATTMQGFISWLLDVIGQGLAIATVVAAVLVRLVKPKIESWIDAKIAPLIADLDSLDKWRSDHDRWSAEKLAEVKGVAEKECALNVQVRREVEYLRERVDALAAGRA
jgi:hypothetical protein